MSRRIVSAVVVSVALATAMHTDWHLARPATHHLSLGLWWHWLLAVPIFALTAWYAARVWPAQLFQASLSILGGAVVLAGVVEPAWEYFLDEATFDWAFGPTRTLALAAFVVTGVITYFAMLAFLRRGQESRIAG